MSSGRWKNEEYYKKAKERGYRARSAYKLINLDEKYDLFKMKNKYADKILDLGCHPGSFIQVILGKYDKLVFEGKIKSFSILGIDKTTIRPFDRPEVGFYRGDVYSKNVEELLEQRGKFGVILSDLAPKTAGDFRDVAIQEDMVLRVFSLLKYLESGGNALIKIFESPDTYNLIRKFKKKFRMVKLTKPKASRSKSREKFLVLKDFL